MEKRLLTYLQRILNSRVYDVATESPLDLARKLPAFQDFIDALGYRCIDETANPVYRLFLR